MPRRMLVASVLALSLALIGCADGGAPPAGEDDGLVRGLSPAQFYAANCAQCHGAEREGVIGPPLRPDTLTESDEEYARVIRNGVPRTPMPAWGGRLTERQIELMVEYLRTEP